MTGKVRRVLMRYLVCDRCAKSVKDTKVPAPHFLLLLPEAICGFAGCDCKAKFVCVVELFHETD